MAAAEQAEAVAALLEVMEALVAPGEEGEASLVEVDSSAVMEDLQEGMAETLETAESAELAEVMEGMEEVLVVEEALDLGLERQL